nr:NADH-quinone oxidoreductase subunit H [Bdellovibrionales bacterium]
LLATLFFGGYGIFPGMEYGITFISNFFAFGEVGMQNTKAAFEFVSFATKVAFFMFMFVWIRWTLPRFRFDQLMDLGWKILFPIALINLVVVTLGVYYFNT